MLNTFKSPADIEAVRELGWEGVKMYAKSLYGGKIIRCARIVLLPIGKFAIETKDKCFGTKENRRMELNNNMPRFKTLCDADNYLLAGGYSCVITEEFQENGII